MAVPEVCVESIQNREEVMAEYLVSPRDKIEPTDPHRWEKLFSQCIALSGAGACQMSAEGKHLYFKDILALGKEHGFDILGMKEDAAH